MFWNCPRISNYWRNIFQVLTKILKRPLDLDPLTTILGIVDSNGIETGMERGMVLSVCLLAQRLILLNWKQKTAPTHLNLMRDVMKHLELEKIRFSLKKWEDKFLQNMATFYE